MQRALRFVALAGVVAAAGMFSAPAAKAQGFIYGGYPGGGYSTGGYYGGGYPVPAYGYYGNGGHDFQPHWHTRQTPFGSYSYYGQGGHDFRPHAHVQTPYGITSYSNGFFSSTQSYSPPYPYPYVFRPW